MIPRTQKLANELKHQISKIIHDEINDPRIGFITIMRVEISADLQLAKIHYSVLGNEKQKKDAAKGLNSAVGFIKKLVGERVKIRYNPDLKFYLDDSSEFVQHMEDILKEDEEKK